MPAVPKYDESKPNYDIPGTSIQQNIVWIARQQKGKPYTYAAPPRTQSVLDKIVGKGLNAAPSTFDCSGLVWFSYSIGIAWQNIMQFQGKDDTHFHPGSMKATYADAQMKTGTDVVQAAELQEGDLCGSELIGGIYGHIAIYTGDNTIVEAAHTGTNIRERPFVATEWQGFARVKGLPQLQSASDTNLGIENQGDPSLHGNPITDIQHLVEGIANVFKAISTAFAHLLDPAFWRKIGLLLGGALLLLVAANELQKGLT